VVSASVNDHRLLTQTHGAKPHRGVLRVGARCSGRDHRPGGRTFPSDPALACRCSRAPHPTPPNPKRVGDGRTSAPCGCPILVPTTVNCRRDQHTHQVGRGATSTVDTDGARRDRGRQVEPAARSSRRARSDAITSGALGSPRADRLRRIVRAEAARNAVASGVDQAPGTDRSDVFGVASICSSMASPAHRGRTKTPHPRTSLWSAI
jgi:hypothetical protein